MSYWSHHPELYDELVKQELIRRIEEAPGECVINAGADQIYEEEFISQFIERRFGCRFATEVAMAATEGYWADLTDHMTEMVKGRREFHAG